MMTLFPCLFVGIGILFIVIAMPLIKRRVKPNSLYGLRVPATFADEWVWYEANASSGRDLAILGIVQLATGLLPPLLIPIGPGVPEFVYAMSNAAVLLVGTVTFAIVGWLRANRMLQERRKPASQDRV
jgi:SdpI/YfhL protein family